jgi:hypothetical protein
MTRMDSVILSGVYKNQPVTARFDRYKRRDCAKSIGWTLAISIGGKCHRYTIRDKSCKPCWTVAVHFMEAPAKRAVELAAKQSARRAREDKHPTGGLRAFDPEATC